MNDSIPHANPDRQPAARWLWWSVPVLTLVVVGWLLVVALAARGPLITIVVGDAHGLQIGDDVRHRGMEVGVVEAMVLQAEAGEIHIQVRLEPSAADLAREGSRFWIERPILGATGISGVETILGGRHIAVIPGRGDPSERFRGLEEPPQRTADLAGGLEIVLEAARRGGLVAGAPISYRQITVGRVVAVNLASDSRSVQVHALIAPRFAELVREDTRFWLVSGVRFEAGLFDGLRLELDSLAALAQGGIAFATPEDPGPAAATGQRFELHGTADEDWLEWTPGLVVGEGLPSGVPLPALERVAVTWTGGGLFAREHRRSSWALPLTAGVLAPSDILAPDRSGDAELFLEIVGERLPLSAARLRGSGDLALWLGPQPAAPWPAERVRVPAQPEDLVLVRSDDDPLPLAAERLQVIDGELGHFWRPRAELALDDSWHGAVAVARSDGAVIGMLAMGEGLRIQPLDAVLVAALQDDLGD